LHRREEGHHALLLGILDLIAKFHEKKANIEKRRKRRRRKKGRKRAKKFVCVPRVCSVVETCNLH